MWRTIFTVVLIAGASLFALGTSRTPHVQRATVHNALRGTQTVPGLVLEKLGGGTINLADYRGTKPVVLDFWASWCPNCRRDMPHLNGFYEKYKDQVEVIGVNLHEDPGTVSSFIASRGISFPIALDPSGSAANAFGIQYTNTHFLINKSGELVRSIPGDIRESDIVSLIDGSSQPSRKEI